MSAADSRTAWMVYMLRCADGSLYTGITTDIQRRLAEHNGDEAALDVGGDAGGFALGRSAARSRDQAAGPDAQAGAVCVLGVGQPA